MKAKDAHVDLEEKLNKMVKQKQKEKKKTAGTSADKYIVMTKLLSRPEGASIAEMQEALRCSSRNVSDVLNQMYFLLTIEKFETYEDVIGTDKDRTITQKRVIKFRSRGQSPDLRFPEFHFTDEELAVFDQIQGNSNLTPALRESASKLFDKFELLAAERGRRIQIGDVSRRLILNAGTINKAVIDSKKAENTIAAILDMIKNQQCMNLIFRKMGQDGPVPFMHVYPVQIFVSNGDTYVWVLNSKKALRMLAIERIEEMDAIPISDEEKREFAKAKASYNFEKLLSDPFGIMLEKDEPYTVKLWINPWETKFLSAKNWPETVKFTFNPDGSSIFETETRTHYECVAWIQARVDRVKILEPKWLRDEVMDNLKKAIAENSQIS